MLHPRCAASYLEVSFRVEPYYFPWTHAPDWKCWWLPRSICGPSSARRSQCRGPDNWSTLQGLAIGKCRSVRYVIEHHTCSKGCLAGRAHQRGMSTHHLLPNFHLIWSDCLHLRSIRRYCLAWAGANRGSSYRLISFLDIHYRQTQSKVA